MTDENTNTETADALADILPEADSAPGTVEELDAATVKRAAAGTPPDSRVVEDPAALGADDLAPASFGTAKPDDGLVRTNSATTPIADVLAAGAGAPHPPPANVDKDGREQFGPDGPATARVDYTGPGAPPEQGAEPADEAVADDKAKTAAKSKAGAAKTG